MQDCSPIQAKREKPLQQPTDSLRQRLKLVWALGFWGFLQRPWTGLLPGSVVLLALPLMSECIVLFPWKTHDAGQTEALQVGSP